MNDLENSWYYRLSGLRGLRVFQLVWFTLIYAFLGVAIFGGIFLPMPWGLRVMCIVLSIVAAGLLTKIHVRFAADVRKVAMEEASETKTTKVDSHP
jgi:hypothetical protein